MISPSRIAFAVSAGLILAAGSGKAQESSSPSTSCDRAQAELNLQGKMLETFREIASDPQSSWEDQESAKGAVIIQESRVDGLRRAALEKCGVGPTKIAQRATTSSILGYIEPEESPACDAARTKLRQFRDVQKQLKAVRDNLPPGKRNLIDLNERQR